MFKFILFFQNLAIEKKGYFKIPYWIRRKKKQKKKNNKSECLIYYENYTLFYDNWVIL